MRELRDAMSFILIALFVLFIIGAVLIALFFLFQWQAATVTTAVMRQSLFETRSGTVLIVMRNGVPVPQLLKPVDLLEPGDEGFDNSQAAIVQTEAPDILKLTNRTGTTFIAKDDPEAEAMEMRRKLALRLLRESMRHYANQNIDPRQTNRIPSWRDLGWSPDTWSRAAEALKPNITTKVGRGGGTFCGAQFPTLMDLYAAVGERRVASLSPTLATVPQMA